jgi:predicted nucleic acid-binding protein
VIVVDASAVLDLLLNAPSAPRLADRFRRPGETLHAPHLLDVEVAHVLRRYAAAGALDADRGAEAIADLLDLPLARYPHHLLLPRAWALRRALTAYDAMYVALAEGLDAPLVTRDGRLARTGGHRARVEVI